MQEKTEIYMRKNYMTEEGDAVLVGLSGGADSVALLLLLWKLMDKLHIFLRAVHVHHGLRGAEADRDAAFSKALCDRLGVRFYEFHIDAAKEARDGRCSLEEAGRKARYRLYEEVAVAWESEMNNKAHVHIATAHHADDSAETILLNLFRGSGLGGLSGIDPVRGRIIRPLLWAERREIQAWLVKQQQEWVEDSTNKESEYSRNWIRNELIPAVRMRLNAQAVRHIDQAGKYIRQADAYFKMEAEHWLLQYASGRGADARKLSKQSDIVQSYIIRELFLRSGMPLKDVTEKHIDAVRVLLNQETGKSISLPHGFRAENTYGSITIYPDSKKISPYAADEPPEICIQLSALPQTNEELSNGDDQCTDYGKLLRMHVFPCENAEDFPKKQYTKWLDYDRIKGDLSLRHRKTGDYLTLPSGGKKSLKSWMIDEKIPRQERDEIWLLAEGEHVLWIVGYRISAYYKITEQTKNILEVEFNGGEKSGG